MSFEAVCCFLVVGALQFFAGASRNHLARLNADGSIDGAFNPGPNADVYALALQADGRILVGGNFTGFGTATRNHAARLNADGSLDGTFDPNVNNSVFAFATLADGRILVGGQFWTVGGVSRHALARLNANGSLDTSFVADAKTGSATGNVYSLVAQPNGRILVAGAFTSLAGVARNHFGRLEANGSIDSGFDPAANGFVTALAVQQDGRVLAAGNFTAIGGAARNYFARLTVPEAAMQSLAATPSSVRWLRSGAGSEFDARPELAWSSNGSSFTQLPAMVRSAGGWSATGLSLPIGQTIYLRARGRTSGGYYNGSQGIVEYTRVLRIDDRIFADGFD
jgi:uncharacterized delta-60 repeat protein